jgi:hypothetical protein
VLKLGHADMSDLITYVSISAQCQYMRLIRSPRGESQSIGLLRKRLTRVAKEEFENCSPRDENLAGQ